jgi:ribonuclease HI
MLRNYIIYTDGAFSSARNQGGLGIIVLCNGKVILTYSNMYKNVTNNQMELGAIILALRMIKHPIKSLIIYSDSQYCIGCAVQGWKRKKNQALWREFDFQYQRVLKLCSEVKFVHIKGHAGNTYNELVDKLAVNASQQL